VSTRDTVEKFALRAKPIIAFTITLSRSNQHLLGSCRSPQNKSCCTPRLRGLQHAVKAFKNHSDALGFDCGFVNAELKEEEATRKFG
jgi:hypothetical protein